ncbi:YybH family protein [Pseudomonas sp. CGJS7]|uniref:YybH family protein n=1 Tax=Pseudomonas sp. CGJS7 TaxID=3109348 RepID=UPI0030095D17
MTDALDPFQQVLQAYAAAVLAKDVEAFVALYDDDVHVFDMWSDWSLRGIEPWRAMASDWFASLGDERVVVEIDRAQSVGGGDVVFGHAFLRYTAFAASGERLRSLDNRISVGMVRRDGRWKIAHEHTSAPIDHAGAKAILQRGNTGSTI